MGLFNKACDRCRARKSRCRFTDSSDKTVCDYCRLHNLACNFSHQKRRQRRKNPDEIVRAASSPAISATIPPQSQLAPLEIAENGEIDGRPGLYIDYILDRSLSSQLSRPNSSHDQLTASSGPSPNISFFPAKRVSAISQRLGHNKLENLLEAIRAVVASKLKTSSSPIVSGLDDYFSHGAERAHQDPQQTLLKEYIHTYMTHVHPFYPFLNRLEFEKRALGPNIAQELASDKPWAALYFAVIAVGCQHNGGGTYDTRSGESWIYFEKSLAVVREIGLLRGSLTSLQALMALAIFCQAVSGFVMESPLLAEAAVLAQNLGLNRLTSSSDRSSIRTFWVLYYMEKTSCFTTRNVPTLQDCHISSPLPDQGVWSFNDYDWLFSFVRYSRLASKIHSQLMTITSVPQPWAARYRAVRYLQSELEAWRYSIPPRFRPGEPLRPRMLHEPHSVSIALRAHYYYHYAHMTLTWTLLHCESDGLDATQGMELKTELMQIARSVLELTSYIEISPATPVWILALMPLTALMILFDLVIHNPSHPETSLNLALLDIASGHFSRIEYSSSGALPGSLISEFAHLARQYISDIRHNTGRQHAYRSTARNRDLHLSQPRVAGLSFSSSMSNAQPNPPSSQTVTEDKPLSDPALQQDAVQHHQLELSTISGSVTEIEGSLPGITAMAETQDPLFFPQVNTTMDDLEFLGVDLMGLFGPAFCP
ncbi:hypothetical protein BJY01DRAFT_211920 [Aspergillus pseudoustus]|uniref:Zn(2)-C6 fungal-type domain-containing protein n=1 Tax=Aspergillus pseudoustus TaxID=1810923 RepID=A0ABR4K9B1_9EURO